MLSKILKVMAIVILLPLFATCTYMIVGAGSSVSDGVAEGYNEAKEAAEAETGEQ